MSLPKAEQFTEFYKAAYDKVDDLDFGPFPWQIRLANRVCRGDWPRVIALPTAAGKTGCIDIALFALACRAKDAPRRIFFIVDRRIVVDQAYIHAKRLAALLREAKAGILKDIADALREIAFPCWRKLSEEEQENIRPLDVYALRGGMYRETAWTRSPLQPTIIASTVDQVGSRLLFRGYGVTDSMKPIHAGLVGNDSLILLDEAHCAKPFEQTMEAVEHYRLWNESVAPFRFLSISATPTREDSPIERDEEDDRKHPVLGKRITASKPATLVVAAKAKGKNGTAELVKVLEEQARELSKQFECVGIIVNRVKTARQLKAKLGDDDAVLLTGRMRPLDSEVLRKQKLNLLLSNSRETQKPPKFVIGTQCLECGADFDFHALVTECASLDALRQRFGRLNRVANRPIAKAVIVIRGDQREDSSKDAVYGASLAQTWQWLNEHADDKSEDDSPWIDFGVMAIREKWDSTSADARTAITAPSSDAPVLFPAHLDCWVQTNPKPMPDPDPALFLHGPKQPGQPDVQVVFRSDLGDDSEKWDDIVSLCPPSSSEAMPVPIGVFKKWLTGKPIDDDSSDVEGEVTPSEDDTDDTAGRYALCWQGVENTTLISDPNQVKPNRVYVLPCSAPDVSLLGDFIGEIPSDYSQEAFQLSRDKAILRLPDLSIPEDATRDEEAALVDEAIHAAGEKFADNAPEWLMEAIAALKKSTAREVDRHPLGGVVVTGKRRLRKFDPTYLEDSEPDDSFRGQQVSLYDHSSGVAEYAKRFASGCGFDVNLFTQAGLWHDLGKLDPRFQAMLKQSSPRTAVGIDLAKSARSPRTIREREEAREVHRYPHGGRHELLSAALVATKTDDDLLLHLITTHHNSGRPLADPVEENEAAKKPFKTSEFFGQTFELPTSAQEISVWNAELPNRFWRIVRKFGWWGAAYYETIFRLADHAQSHAEQEEMELIVADVKSLPFAAKSRQHDTYTLPLPGLDGANPLAFLAALGTLVVCHEFSDSNKSPPWLAVPVSLSWGTGDSPYIPVLHFSAGPPKSSEFAEFLGEQLARSPNKHSSSWVVNMLASDGIDLVEQIRRCCRKCDPSDRPRLDWVTALVCESVPNGASQLQTVRKDYLLGNLHSIMQRTTAKHLFRSLFLPWDYTDALDNQSLHWEPSEDRRHAYQWHQPSGDPTRKKRGGMLGANRLALEAWPLFPSFPADGVFDRLATRGFSGNRASDTYWTWPLWNQPLTKDAVASILGIPHLQGDAKDLTSLHCFGLFTVFRVQRILVGKTPNFTTTMAMA